jgi:hypothetical protein
MMMREFEIDRRVNDILFIQLKLSVEDRERAEKKKQECQIIVGVSPYQTINYELYHQQKMIDDIF